MSRRWHVRAATAACPCRVHGLVVASGLGQVSALQDLELVQVGVRRLALTQGASELILQPCHVASDDPHTLSSALVC